MSRFSPEEFKKELPKLNNLTIEEAAAVIGITTGALQNRFSREGHLIRIEDKIIHVLSQPEKKVTEYSGHKVYFVTGEQYQELTSHIKRRDFQRYRP